MDFYYSTTQTPSGNILIKCSDSGLHFLSWVGDDLSLKSNKPMVIETIKQIDEYFSLKRKTFDLPLIIEGTEFQKKAWKVLMEIPYGVTISYSEQAQLMGDINKSRAVGGANSKNPIPIIIPCHRVVGKNGKLVGFSSGLDKKEFLLDFEKGKLSLLNSNQQL